MKIIGFTFVRNAIKFDYPIVESIKSILPIVDEYIVLVGNSEDETEKLIKNIESNKIKIYHSVWDDSLREGGRVLAVETDKAFAKVPDDADWAFYLQADEVIHEQDLDKIYSAMKKYKDDNLVEGLLFNYMHFYGSYDYIGDAYRWYRYEVRVIRNNKNIKSYGDAKGFRWADGRKLRVKHSGAYVYHYGWVRNPRAMMEKQRAFHGLYHNDKWIERHLPKTKIFNYSKIDSLRKFTDSHPAVMKERIARQNWHFDYDLSYNSLKPKDRFKRIVERLTGWRIGEPRNFVLLKD